MTPAEMLIASCRLGEGCELEAYPDPLTKGEPWTIGYGRAHGVKPGDTCTQAEADLWLAEDCAAAVAELVQRLPWTSKLDPVRFVVMAELLFNMGWRRVDAAGRVHGLSTFTNTLELVRQGAYGQASENLLHSAWAHQVGSRGVRLARRLASGVA